jgi:hypothetical protein
VTSLLYLIAGVYSVAIDVDNQKVSVTGDVDSDTLIKKLTRGGKHAELWSQQKGSGNQGHKGNNQQKQQHHHQQQQQQDQKQVANPTKDGNNKNNGGQKDQGKQGGVGGLMQGLKAFKSQHNNKHQFSELSSEEDDLYDDDDEFDDDYEEELRFLGDKMSQLGFHSNGHQNKNGNNANVNNNHNNANGKKANAGSGASGASHHQNQNANVMNMAAANVKMASGAQNPKNANVINMAAANAKLGNGAERNAGAHNGMFGLSHGLGAGNAAPGIQGYTGFNHPSYAPAGYGGPQQHHIHQQQNSLMASMQGYHHHPAATAAMMNNLRGLNSNMMMHQPQQQPQMYYPSHQISPYTGYYNPCNYYYHPGAAGYPLANNGDVENMLSDENTKGCVVM